MILFQIEYQLCKEFPALHPWEVEIRKFREVIRLFAETKTVQMATAKEIKSRRSGDDVVIRRPAGDSWF